MILIGLADVHEYVMGLDHIGEVLKTADAVFLLGDITHFGHARQMAQVVGAIQRYTHKLWGIHGNCDHFDAQAYMENQGLNLHARGRIIGGLGVVGLGGSLYTPFATPNEHSESQIRKFLSKGIAEVPKEVPFIVVSHQPPFDTACDRLRSGRHVGSVALREFIERRQPLICFSGHIHEAVAVDRIGRTQVVNPGPFGRGRYAYAEITEAVACVDIRKIV